MTQNIPLSITQAGEEYVERLSDVLTAAFNNDPFGRAIAVDRLAAKGIAWNESAHNTFDERRPGFQKLVKEDQEIGGILVEAGDWVFVGVWYAPGTEKAHDEDPSEMPLVVQEYQTALDAVRKKWLKGRRHWYCHFLGRDPKRTEPGGARAVITPFLQKAQEEKVPAWIEASNSHARDVYMHFGFKLVDYLHVGVGRVDANGYPNDSGEGITMYALIYETDI